MGIADRSGFALLGSGCFAIPGFSICAEQESLPLASASDFDACAGVLESTAWGSPRMSRVRSDSVSSFIGLMRVCGTSCSLQASHHPSGRTSQCALVTLSPAPLAALSSRTRSSFAFCSTLPTSNSTVSPPLTVAPSSRSATPLIADVASLSIPRPCLLSAPSPVPVPVLSSVALLSLLAELFPSRSFCPRSSCKTCSTTTPSSSAQTRRLRTPT
mmetsp:Transcript_12766/g.34319  ORF Transcript_12766/g.34319 Transcript_12766/m.34319 type:complete len:215 (-) Transcript_12766:43-687(-)